MTGIARNNVQVRVRRGGRWGETVRRKTGERGYVYRQWRERGIRESREGTDGSRKDVALGKTNLRPPPF